MLIKDPAAIRELIVFDSIIGSQHPHYFELGLTGKSGTSAFRMEIRFLTNTDTGEDKHRKLLRLRERLNLPLTLNLFSLLVILGATFYRAQWCRR